PAFRPRASFARLEDKAHPTNIPFGKRASGGKNLPPSASPYRSPFVLRGASEQISTKMPWLIRELLAGFAASGAALPPEALLLLEAPPNDDREENISVRRPDPTLAHKPSHPREELASRNSNAEVYFLQPLQRWQDGCGKPGRPTWHAALRIGLSYFR